MKLAGIIFDMDGTLLDTERLALRAWNATLAQTGVTFPDDFVHSIIGANGKTARSLASKALGSVDRAEAFFEDYGVVYREHLAREGLPIKKGAPEILKWARGRGLRLAMATSTRRSVASEKLAEAGFQDFFEVIVCGDEVEHGKPAPDIFVQAYQRLDLPPEQLVAVEDSPNGVRSAHAAGLRTILIPDLAPLDAEVKALAWAVVNDLPRAQEKISSLL